MQQTAKVQSNAVAASVFIATDLADLPAAVKWNAVLAGGMVCTWSFVRDRTGPTLAYHAALQVRRLIWMTDLLLVEHAGVAETIAERMATFRAPNSRRSWQMARGEAHFLERAAKEPTVAVLFAGSLEVEHRAEAWRSASDQIDKS